MTAVLPPKPVSEWGDPLPQPIGHPTEPDPCDCGLDGPWPVRWRWEWYEPGAHERREMRKAHRASAGRWCRVGWEERCPGCGDIEVFDFMSGELVEAYAEQAAVVPFRRR